MRMTIAAEKAFEPKDIAALRATDNHRPAGAGLEQPDATQDQGAHDPLSELRLGDQQSPQPVRWYDQGFHSFLRVGVHKRRPPR